MSGIAAKIRLYRPLIIVLILAVMGALALSLRGIPFMQGLMGLFLCLLAFLQMLDLTGFAMLFRRYDPLAKALPVYGKIYPLLEAALGLLYLSGTGLILAALGTLVLLSINTMGVARVLRSGETVQCGCAGAAFALPVGRVTLVENTVMIAMAILMLTGF